jgi:glycosyltransferase involved in cell wall biosynthesis
MVKVNAKITIAIPAYNSEKTIADTLRSANKQDYPMKEILVLDDGSTDRTAEIAKAHGARVLKNKKNKGIGKALERLMKHAHTKYIIYLCADDQFTHPSVVKDYVEQFDKGDPAIGVLGRYFYQYMDGHDGAIMVSRDTNILTLSCCPSGMAFRVREEAKSTNKIFIEMPTMVKWYLDNGYRWSMFEYDTIKARIHPGGNTGTKTSYYKGSMYESWYSLLKEEIVFDQGFVQIRNRSPKTLLKEIAMTIKINKKCMLRPSWWFFVIISLVFPGFILRPLSNFYRHRITRRFCKIIERPE